MLLVLMVATVVVLPVALPLVLGMVGTNVEDPRVLVVITLVNTLGIVLLIAADKAISRANGFATLVPASADPPQRRPKEQLA